MKHVLAFLTVVLLMFGSANAQDATYLDSLQASGVTNANTHTQGFSAFVLLGDDIADDYEFVYMYIYDLNITDSIKVQGAVLNATRDVADTQWVDLEFTRQKVASTGVDAGFTTTVDTTVTWLTDVGWDNGTAVGMHRLPTGYDLYRVCTGKNDSGKVYVRTRCWDGAYGALFPPMEHYDAYRIAAPAVACYFEHQRG